MVNAPVKSVFTGGLPGITMATPLNGCLARESSFPRMSNGVAAGNSEFECEPPQAIIKHAAAARNMNFGDMTTLSV